MAISTTRMAMVAETTTPARDHLRHGRYSREHSQNLPHSSRFCPPTECPVDILRSTARVVVGTWPRRQTKIICAGTLHPVWIFHFTILGPMNEMADGSCIVSAHWLPDRADLCQLQAWNDCAGSAKGIPTVQDCRGRGNGGCIQRRSVCTRSGNPALSGGRRLQGHSTANL